MNRWLQTKLYECPRCRAQYVHDKGYQHELFLCLKRKLAVSPRERRDFTLNITKENLL